MSDAPQYLIDRKMLIQYALNLPALKERIYSMMLEDLVFGGEYIITAEDVLMSLETVPGYLVHPLPESRDEKIPVKHCKIIYNP